MSKRDFNFIHSILLLILLFLITPSFASYYYQTEAKGLIRAFGELQFLFEYYKNNTGIYPVSDSNSTAMYKLAVFINKNNPIIDSSRKNQMNLSEINHYCLRDIKYNNQFIVIEYSGTGDTETEMLDFWGNPIQILIPGNENPVDFYSFGTNGKFDNYSIDDIISWGDPYDERYNKYYPIPLTVRINWFIKDILHSPIPLIGVPLIFIFILFSVFKKRP